MRNLDLDRCWKLCKQMWKYVAGEFERGYLGDVNELKLKWLHEHGMHTNNANRVSIRCFFCEWSEQVNKEFDMDGRKLCSTCPGKLVDPTFGCDTPEYNYANKPQAFYQEILRLDKIR